MLKVKNELSLQIPVHSYHKDIRKFRTRSLGAFCCWLWTGTPESAKDVHILITAFVTY